MRKMLLLAACLILLSSAVYAGIIISAGGPFCAEYFTTGDTGAVATNTMFDYENDAEGDLNIVSNKLVGTVDNTTSAYVRETTCVSNSDTYLEWHFDLTFGLVEDVDDAATGSHYVLTSQAADASQTNANYYFSAVDNDVGVAK